MVDASRVRSAMLIGREGVERLAACRVAVFGLGGVGGYAAEALARSGVGALDLVDGDVVAQSNLNRQLIALQGTVGQGKAELMARRVLDINPDAQVRTYPVYYTADNAGEFDLSRYDHVLDCVDMVSAKVELAVRAQAALVPLISAMGAGNKLDPTCLRVGDLFETTVCPLARVMRRELRARGIARLPVAYSTEVPLQPQSQQEADDPTAQASARRATPGSMAFVPGAMGLAMASYVVRALLSRG